jgi:hypothetical protein
MTFEDLRREYEVERIGLGVLGEVRSIVHGLSRRYDPTIYAGVTSWRDAEEDVAQGVVVDVLLAEGQLDYLMSVSTDIESFRRLLRFQIKRYLARKRQRSVVDNLLDRAREIMSRPPFVVVGSAGYGLEGRAVEDRDATEAELRRAIGAASGVPRVPVGSADRAPIVYSKEDLARLLVLVTTSLPCRLSIRDLDSILKSVLTGWVASFLYDFEEARTASVMDLSPEEAMVAKTATQEILDRCPAEGVLILARRLEGVRAESIAEELGVTRQTVAARQKRLWGIVRDVLSDLPEQLQEAAIAELSARLQGFEDPSRAER